MHTSCWYTFPQAFILCFTESCPSLSSLFLAAMPSGCSIHLLLFTSFSYLYRLCLILTNASNTCSNKIFSFCDRCSRHLYALLPNIRPGGHNWPGKDSNLDRWKALDNMNQCIAELSHVLQVFLLIKSPPIHTTPKSQKNNQNTRLFPLSTTEILLLLQWVHFFFKM